MMILLLLLLLLLMLAVVILPPHGDGHYDTIGDGKAINEWRAMSSLRNGLRSMVMSVFSELKLEHGMPIWKAGHHCGGFCFLFARFCAFNRCSVRACVHVFEFGALFEKSYIAESSFRNLRVFEKTIWTLVGMVST